MVWLLKSTGVQQGRFPLKSANRRSADKAGLTPKRNVNAKPTLTLPLSLRERGPPGSRCSLEYPRYRPVAPRLPPPMRPLAHTLKQHIQRRDKQDANHRRHQHSAEYRGADDPPALRPGAGGEHHRHDADNK